MMEFLASQSNPHISPLELPGARLPPPSVSTDHFLVGLHPTLNTPPHLLLAKMRATHKVLRFRGQRG